MRKTVQVVIEKTDVGTDYCQQWRALQHVSYSMVLECLSHQFYVSELVLSCNTERIDDDRPGKIDYSDDLEESGMEEVIYTVRVCRF